MLGSGVIFFKMATAVKLQQRHVRLLANYCFPSNSHNYTNIRTNRHFHTSKLVPFIAFMNLLAINFQLPLKFNYNIILILLLIIK